MRKILLLSVLLLFQGSFLYALKDCSDLGKEYADIKDQVVSSMEKWQELAPTDPTKALYGTSLSDLLSKGVKVENEYNECLSSISAINNLIRKYFDL